MILQIDKDDYFDKINRKNRFYIKRKADVFGYVLFLLYRPGRE